MTNPELMAIAIESMLMMDADSPAFEVSELFLHGEWAALTPGQRRSFGKYFAKAARCQDVEGIRFMPISKNGRHNMYKIY